MVACPCGGKAAFPFAVEGCPGDGITQSTRCRLTAKNMENSSSPIERIETAFSTQLLKFISPYVCPSTQLLLSRCQIIYPQYFSGCNATRSQYQQAEAGARQNRLAFWSQPNRVLPWDFRAGRRTPQQPAARPSTAPAPTQAAGTPLRAATTGQGCQCPYDIDARGRTCGGRSAYSRPGGEEPKCYVGD